MAGALTTRRDFIARGLKAGLSLAGVSALAANSKRLVGGVAKRVVTPPASIPFLTSSANGTCAAFNGVHDTLYSRALVLDDGVQRLAVLAVDSIGYDNLVLGHGRNFTRELRKRIAVRTSLSADSIMLTATHAHSTPETIGLTNFREFPGASEWLEQHLNTLIDTVVSAWKTRVPMQARFGKISVPGIARNRRILLKNKTLSRYGPLPAAEQIAAPWFLDEDLGVLSFETEGGLPYATLLNFTAHPVVTMLLPNVSADYPGAAAALVEEKFQNSICLFTQGAAGNINSVHVSTRYEDATELGVKVGKAAISKVLALKDEPAIANPSVQVRAKTVHLEPRNCPSLRQLKKLVSADPSPKNLRLLRMAQKLSEGGLEAELQVMRIGSVGWISLPGEPFVETGLALKESGASFVCGYANGWLGYFPFQRAYGEGGYEVDMGTWSRVAAGSAERLEFEGRNLLHKFIRS